MSKFKEEGSHEAPPISTASLPDIVFMLLFFFMVTTVMREDTLKVDVKLPNATEITKLQDKNLVSYIYIGEPTKKYINQYGSAPRLQLNDKFAGVNQVGSFVELKRSKVAPSEVPLMTFSLKVDEDIKMGIVTDVKQELRKSNALKINYSAIETEKIK